LHDATLGKDNPKNQGGGWAPAKPEVGFD
jgi:hypothetical protein